MAISNYNYHSQHPLPGGENWMKKTNPCKVIDKSIGVYAQLFMETLGGPGVYRLMEYEDFEIVQRMCHALYDNNNNNHRLQQSSQPQQSSSNHPHPGFYTHLLNLPPTQGLLLATTYLLLGHGGDILRMANNIIKLRQLQLLERQIHYLKHQHEETHERNKVQVLTMSMDHFILHPKEATMQFLNFISSSNSAKNRDGGGVKLTLQEKEEIATRYEQMYYEKVTAGDEHITSLSSSSSNKAKSSDTDTNDTVEKKKESMVVMNESSMKLETSLRENVVFGRILGNIENLVEESLRGVHNWY